MVRRWLVAALVAGALVLPALARAQDTVGEDDLVRASDGRTVRVGSPSTGRVVTLPIEVYVARVLAGEGEPTHRRPRIGRWPWPFARSLRPTRCGTGRRASSSATRRIARYCVIRLKTRGALRWPPPAPFSCTVACRPSCSTRPRVAGRTERAADLWSGIDFPYLQSAIDDVHEADEPWTVDLSLEQIQRALQRAGFAGTRLRDVRVESRNVSARVNRLRIDGMRPTVITGEQFRLAVGATVLRSTAFSMERRPGGVRFTGRGYGHGVGMCVVGAGRRAARGATHEEILAQYYPGLELADLGGRAGAMLELAAVLPAAGAITANVPAVSQVSAFELEALAARARDEMGAALGVPAAPGSLTLDLHASLDSFWLATGQPWWMGSVARGRVIHLAPAAVLSQRDGLDMAVRVAVGRMLVSGTLADRPAWVRVGAARYYARVTLGGSSVPGARAECPSDAELALAISAAVLRDAESRAESCFVAAHARTGDWRLVR